MIHVLNRKMLTKLVKKGSLPPNCIVISFHDSDKRPISGLKTENSVVLCVDDLDMRDKDRGIVFSKSDALAILSKIFPLKKDVNIICQCEAGISRSVGCAMAIRELTGLQYAFNFNMQTKVPNMHIYRTIVNTFLYKD